MASYQITSAVLGLLIASGILWLVRKDILHGRFALWWLGVAVGCAVLGLFPRLIDWIASFLGVNYPPILAVVLALAFLVLKIIIMDIERSRNEIKIHRLAQRLAILEGEIAERNRHEGGNGQTWNRDSL